jgi:hypothetical protein
VHNVSDLLEAVFVALERKGIKQTFTGVINGINGRIASVSVDGSNGTKTAVVASNVKASAGDEVVLVHLPRSNQWIITAAYTAGGVARQVYEEDGQIHPPDDIYVDALHGALSISWSAPIGFGVLFEVQVNDTDDEDGNEQIIAITRGSNMIWPVPDEGTRYFRIRSITEDGQFSGWSDWYSGTSLPVVDTLPDPPTANDLMPITVTNYSGATVAEGDVGILNYNPSTGGTKYVFDDSGGEVGTEGFHCVVVEGGIDGADITVLRQSDSIMLNKSGDCRRRSAGAVRHLWQGAGFDAGDVPRRDGDCACQRGHRHSAGERPTADRSPVFPRGPGQ